MGEIMDRLWSIQQLENELFEVRRQRDGEQARLDSRSKKLDDLRKAVAAKREDSLRKQADAKNCELETKTLQEQISGLRIKLNMCRNNKEYSALLSEIASAEARGESIVERSYKLEADSAAAKTEAAALEQQLKAEEEQQAKTDAAIRARLAELTRKVEGIEAKRKEMLAAVPADTRGTFERLSKKLDGHAIAPMELVDPDAGDCACTGCNMHLTAGVVSAVINNDDIRTCPTCTRILYYQG